MNDSIYDKNGHLIYRTIPTQFPEKTILTSNTPRMITRSNRKWMIYDSVYTYGDDKEMFERLEFSFEKDSLFNMKVWMKLLVKKKGPYPFWI